MKDNRVVYKVKEKIQETPDVVTLKFSCDKGIPKYCAGQFITIFFDETGNAEGKAYTISSEPSSETLNITVKGVGMFSNKLCAMKIGDKVEASLPYGYFYSESDTSPLIMIAGGMGVAPFRSMIIDSIVKKSNRKIFLFNSNKSTNDIIFRKELEKLQLEKYYLKVNNYITQQDNSNLGHSKLGLESSISVFKYGRIKVVDILEETKNIQNKEFLICGSISFVRDFWKGLKESGVPEETIYTEAFF